MGSKKEWLCLPYGNLVTMILEHARYNFGEEEYIEDVIKIGKSLLKWWDMRSSMEKWLKIPQIKEKGDGWTRNTYRSWEVWLHYYQLPLTKDPLEVIIKKLDVTNGKIDLITRHFIKDLVILPQDLFLDDHYDIK